MNATAPKESTVATMNWIEGTDRQQQHFLPACVEDYVDQNNPVRVLDALVDSLDLRALGFLFPKENSQNRGRPPYRPGSLLKLLFYGYLQQIRSSRRMERECARNLEVMWLLQGLKPDFKTIADFRKNNAAAFKGVVSRLSKLCQELDLFGGSLLAVDGPRSRLRIHRPGTGV